MDSSETESEASRQLVWTEVQREDEKIPRLKAEEGSDDDGSDSSDSDDDSDCYSDSIVSSPTEILKAEEEEAAAKAARKAKRESKKRSPRQRGKKNLGGRSIMWCTEHFESETPNPEEYTTHCTKHAVIRSTKPAADEGGGNDSSGKEDDEPQPGPSQPRFPSPPWVTPPRQRKKKYRRKRDGRGVTRWCTRTPSRRKMEAGPYDSADSIDSSPERYRNNADVKPNEHILRRTRRNSKGEEVVMTKPINFRIDDSDDDETRRRGRDHT